MVSVWGQSSEYSTVSGVVVAMAASFRMAWSETGSSFSTDSIDLLTSDPRLCWNRPAVGGALSSRNVTSTASVMW